MSYAEIVAEYAAERRGRVVLLPSAAVLAPALPGSIPWGDDTAPGSGQVLVALVVDAVDDQTESLAAMLGKGDVAVVLLPSVPADLPVGPMVTAFTAAGLRILRAEGVRLRQGRTALVVTTDQELAAQGYLTGATLPSEGAGMARLVNEWLVERLQSRALLERLEARLTGATAEAAAMQAERDRFQEEAARAAAELAGMRVTLRAMRAEQGRTLAARVRKAGRLVREDPVRGGVRFARAAARRLRV